MTMSLGQSILRFFVDKKFIRAIFLSIDANAILWIPLRSQDWWAWEPEKQGGYIVKSVYRKLVHRGSPRLVLQVISPGNEFGS